MARYILVYEISDYPEMGGGRYAEFFESNEEQKMHNRVNELANSVDNFSIIIAGFMSQEYEYKPIEVIKEYRPEHKK